jgi:hypothetical protein
VRPGRRLPGELRADDIGYMDEGGRLDITQRKRRMIIAESSGT